MQYNTEWLACRTKTASTFTQQDHHNGEHNKAVTKQKELQNLKCLASPIPNAQGSANNFRRQLDIPVHTGIIYHPLASMLKQ